MTEKASKILNFILGNDFESIANLEFDENEIDFLKCKIIALINLERYSEALEICQHYRQDMQFEYCYLLYRCNHLEKALEESIRDGENFGHLRAVLLYRLERFEEAIKLYKSNVNHFADVETNLGACVAMQGLLPSTLIPKSFASLFNCALLYSNIQQYNLAFTSLLKAEEKCKEEMLGEGSSIEEIDRELAIIWAQKGFVLHCQGFNEEALKMYQMALNSTFDL